MMRQRRYYPPKEDFIGFGSEKELQDKVAEWGLGKSAVQSVWYKDEVGAERVKLAGYIEYGTDNQFNTVIVEFSNGELSCIHPPYLKEMQSGSFGKASAKTESETEEAVVEPAPVAKEKKKVAKPKATKKSAAPKKDLPTDKVHFIARVTGFGEKYNPFNEDQPDEIVLLDEVKIIGENEIEIGKAWCGYSKTLKKHELAENDRLEFDAKIVVRKHEDSPYKINNPSKIAKLLV